jgi:hypothetical protein
VISFRNAHHINVNIIKVNRSLCPINGIGSMGGGKLSSTKN